MSPTSLLSMSLALDSILGREDKLWLFDSPESSKIGTYIPLEKAVISDGVFVRSPSRMDVDRAVSDQLNTFEVIDLDYRFRYRTA